ncbi:hypothetical protein RF11_00967 [Thelohanellus kitauei]|uniref:Uncharacterized protein n=1 Tax=Thelohanellus kitauei TaxID=669202 RepID=A0A0C2N5Y9_THEKT|nr:hypothetical protein RF11_00967 [Thelohanellus kitauei]
MSKNDAQSPKEELIDTSSNYSSMPAFMSKAFTSSEKLNNQDSLEMTKDNQGSIPNDLTEYYKKVMVDDAMMFAPDKKTISLEIDPEKLEVLQKRFSIFKDQMH